MTSTSLTVAAPGERSAVREPGGVERAADVGVQMRALHQLTIGSQLAQRYKE